MRLDAACACALAFAAAASAGAAPFAAAAANAATSAATSAPISAATAAAIAAVGSALTDTEPGAPFVPPARPAGVVRIWGTPAMEGLVRVWAEGFQRAHPALRIESRLTATGLAMPGLYSGAADIALFGRDTNTTDNDGFEHVLGYRHLAVDVASGSANREGKSPAIVAFVHRDNPLSRLTLAQLDAICGAERRRGAPGAIVTWGDLGLTGEWKVRPITLYADDTRSGPAQFFQRVVLRDSRKWNWDRLTEFHAVRNPDGSLNSGSRQSLEALRADRFGLALSNLGCADARVKPLALASDSKGPFYEPTKANLIARTYPLARPIVACVNRPPGKPLDPDVADFLRYVLSPAGQRDIERAGGYLPLSAEFCRIGMKKLNERPPAR